MGIKNLALASFLRREKPYNVKISATKLAGSEWPYLSSSSDYPHLPCTGKSASVQSPAKIKCNYQKKCMVSQTGHKPKWFFSSVGDQMLSEITVVEGRKLAPLHCVKSESSKKIYNQIQSSQMVALINGLVPNFFFADWAAGFLCWVPSAQRSPTWWSNPSPAEGASPP